MNGTSIMRLTFKLLNPEDVIRVLARGKRVRGRGREGERVRKQKKESTERVSVTVLRETVKQNDSTGLLFERLPACQFQCNIFIDTLLTAT